MIAAHDQLNVNGQGCWASNRRLAELIGCHVKSVPRAVRRLIKFGYLKDLGARPGKQRGRRRFLSVIYTSKDGAAFNPAGSAKVTQQVTLKGTSPVTQRYKGRYSGEPVAGAPGKAVEIGRLYGAPGRPLPTLQADLAKRDAARRELALELGKGNLTKGFAILGKMPDRRRGRHV